MIERKESSRRRFLDEATRLFGELGFHQTTVPMIVAAAGKSTGAFYLHFHNKEDVFAAAMEALDRRICAAIDGAAANAGPSVLSHMRAAVTAMVGFLAANPGEARILLVESSGLGKRLEEVRRRVIESHTRGVEHALAIIADRLPPMDISVTARCWVGAAYEAVFRWLEEPATERMSPEHLADAVAAFNLRGIGAPSIGPEPNTGGKRI
jgi:AcrR family transcriptional regulator